MHRTLPLAAALAFTCVGFGLSAQAADSSYQFDSAKGEALYTNTCAACHQANGEGIPNAFPPLKGNPVVLNDNPTQQIDTVLKGRHGEITVLGKKYNGFMQAFGDQLKDVEIADIINYERSSWGNKAKHVTPDGVAKVRAGGKL